MFGDENTHVKIVDPYRVLVKKAALGPPLGDGQIGQHTWRTGYMPTILW